MLLALPDNFSLGVAALTNDDFVTTLAVCSQRYPLALLAISLIIVLVFLNLVMLLRSEKPEYIISSTVLS